MNLTDDRWGIGGCCMYVWGVESQPHSVWPLWAYRPRTAPWRGYDQAQA
jgi:hypothetical protein